MINAAARWLARCGLVDTRFDASALHDEVRAQLGATVEADPRFLDRFRKMVEAVNSTQRQSFIGRRGLGRHFRRNLTAHFMLRQRLAEEPAVTKRPLSRPLFIIGWPRTGTTLLHHLLALDPGFRTVNLLQMMNPLRTVAENRVTMGREHKDWAAIAPGARSVHDVDIEEPNECWFLLMKEFGSTMPALVWGIFEYAEWLVANGAPGSYEGYRAMLQILAGDSTDRPYLLKCPSHLWRLPDLIAAFPDARLVFLHREATSALPSFCSLLSFLHQAFLERPDPVRLGRFMAEHFEEGLSRGLEARRTHPAALQLDLPYAELVADPVRAVRRIYDDLGYTPPADLEGAVRAHLASHPQHAHGIHRYACADFGLDERALADRFDRLIKETPCASPASSCSPP